jgi:hypothetical protein
MFPLNLKPTLKSDWKSTNKEVEKGGFEVVKSEGQ